MNNHKELAKAYFLEGYNCAQAVVLAFHEELGFDKQTAACMASCFGGGMGRLREVCGTVSGMFIVLGLLKGYHDPKDQDGKKALYEQVQHLAHTFKEHNKSIICRELLGLDHHTDEPTPSARTPEYYKRRPCAELAADAADILEQFLKNS
ncbi:MAG: C_GCAxxG_C_C family protein [Lachnospiraceae bacterium]|jgi:C_GCAxxG_C_C family probable redox protein|nr:C_GCAxxG_C_C family protein [Lachnospiraceae bacterium]